MAERSGAEALARHLEEKADAAIVMQRGSADSVIASLLTAGWTLEERAEVVAGKRIRYMHPPESVVSE
jgi:hypothetical protein